jgi:phosphatidylserine/phosphatidylglycerophosphate/cardiolipin synthase-like enzyme
MRFKSKEVDGFTVYAVSGINTVSFGINATAAAKKNLLGFAVVREDVAENEKYTMPGFKVFKSVIPNPDDGTQVSTFDHPVQSFVWDDFTAKDGHQYTYWFHPIRGTPKNLDKTAKPVKIVVTTEPLFSTQAHDVFFNRGVASSQAYTRKFQNMKPDKLAEPKRTQAFEWLSRKLDDALLRFISSANAGDQLLCCFYEFRYLPVAQALKQAMDRGVDVRLILDGKVNESTDKKGKFHESFPFEDNKRMVTQAGIPGGRITWRQARPNDIQHNKFMILLKGPGKNPKELWTGSTNISAGGIFGQTNVGHWVRDAATAGKFRDYWLVLKQDLGGQAGDPSAAVRKKNDDLKKRVEAVSDATPSSGKAADLPIGISSIFSPRKGLDALKFYVELLDNSQKLGCITLAFGINKAFKESLANNTPANALMFALLEKEDKPSGTSTQPFVFIGAKQNVYKAWGSFLKDPLYQWTRETNAKSLQLNQHVSYVHSKFLLRDPLGADPIVVTGSANFSDASTTSNDENMLIIRGDRRAADIYFTEFNRLFNHYYFRSVVEATTRAGATAAETSENLFLKEKAADWLEGYKAGSLRDKRLKVLVQMAI